VIRWVRAVEAWLDGVGLRRAVLLSAGSAGLAAAVVSGVALGQLSAAVTAARGATGGEQGPLPALVGQAVAESLAQATATDPIAAQDFGRRFARTSKAVDAAVPAAARGGLTADQRSALTRFGRSWQEYQDARLAALKPAARGDAARGDAPGGDAGGRARLERARLAPALARTLAALQAVTVTARDASRERDLRARGAYYRAQLVLALLLAIGLVGSAALLRLAGEVLARVVGRVAAFLRGDPGRRSGSAESHDPTDGTGQGSAELARGMVAATDLMQAAVTRLERAHRELAARTVAGPAATDDGWWLRPSSPR
jgi:hypothetical protein